MSCILPKKSVAVFVKSSFFIFAVFVFSSLCARFANADFDPATYSYGLFTPLQGQNSFYNCTDYSGYHFYTTPSKTGGQSNNSCDQDITPINSGIYQITFATERSTVGIAFYLYSSTGDSIGVYIHDSQYYALYGGAWNLISGFSYSSNYVHATVYIQFNYTSYRISNDLITWSSWFTKDVSFTTSMIKIGGYTNNGWSEYYLFKLYSSAPECDTFTYSDWSACSTDNLTTRTLLTSGPDGCEGGTPVLSSYCDYFGPNNPYFKIDFVALENYNFPNIAMSSQIVYDDGQQVAKIYPTLYTNGALSYSMATSSTAFNLAVHLYNNATSSIASSYNVVVNSASSSAPDVFNHYEREDTYYCMPFCANYTIPYNDLKLYDDKVGYEFTVKSNTVFDETFRTDYLYVMQKFTSSSTLATSTINLPLFSCEYRVLDSEQCTGFLKEAGCLWANAFIFLVCPHNYSLNQVKKTADSVTSKFLAPVQMIGSQLEIIKNSGTGAELPAIVFTTDTGMSSNTIPIMDIPILDLNSSQVKYLANALYPYEAFAINFLLVYYLYGVVRVSSIAD